MGLTPVALQQAKPAGKPFKLYDRLGLYAIIAPSGSKLWRFDYRFGGKRKTLAFGPWPAVSLAVARERRDAAREKLAAGRDPAANDDAPAPSSNAPTFRVAAEAWFEARKPRWAKTYSGRIWNRLRDDILPEIGDRPLDLIEPPELLTAIRKIEGRGAIELAKRVKNYCGEVFRYGIAEGWCKRDPSSDISAALKPRPRTKHRPALPFDQMAEFMGRLSNPALEFLVLTIVRTRELRLAEWKEIEGDLWRIPGEHMKGGVEHLVPLSRQAQDVLKRLPRHGSLIFPSPGRPETPLSENALIYSLYRMGLYGSATVHGFRATFSSAANESGLWNPDAVEKQLAHLDDNEVRRAYNRAAYLDERRRMLQWWADAILPQDEFEALLG